MQPNGENGRLNRRDGVSKSASCVCDGIVPWCAPCVAGVVMMMWSEHPDSLSVSMLRRRIPGLLGREAALLLEAARFVPLVRSGTHDGYVEPRPNGVKAK